MKKTFIAPKANMMTLQTEQLMQTSGATVTGPSISKEVGTKNVWIGAKQGRIGSSSGFNWK